ncbi:cytochrome C oxidase subunit IV family protein [Mycobacterium avium]|uniref:cytochrome C oxidase subunit IV family protein n=1 Tax=Mycobacterium avium TaxID=1764 RepID=UPI001CC7870D|nr:cytochrome C oxidase subunit IV family protein [Mycobacterium avium]MBZ4618485.1 cytochrome C oxidase subunit IV family protein [Mycobacterium avium subsp. hominissuis]
MPRSLFNARSPYVWLALVSITTVSWAVGAEHGIGSTVAVVVLALAMIKIRFVGLDFMELRTAPHILRGVFEAYCAVLWTVLAGMYLWL